MFDKNNRTEKYVKFTHQAMIHDFCLDYHLGWRILCKRLGYAENVNTISVRLSHEYYKNTLK